MHGEEDSIASFGPGQGGKIEVNVEKEAVFTGLDKNGEYASGLFSSSEATTDPAGAGGSVVITAGRLVLTNQAQLSARTKGPGPGGNVKVQAKAIHLANDAKITARSEALGDAGQIEINLSGGGLTMKNASIQTSAQNADGGNLVLISPRYVYLVGSQISTSVSEEFGGGGNNQTVDLYIDLVDAVKDSTLSLDSFSNELSLKYIGNELILNNYQGSLNIMVFDVAGRQIQNLKTKSQNTTFRTALNIQKQQIYFVLVEGDNFKKTLKILIN